MIEIHIALMLVKCRDDELGLTLRFLAVLHPYYDPAILGQFITLRFHYFLLFNLITAICPRLPLSVITQSVCYDGISHFYIGLRLSRRIEGRRYDRYMDTPHRDEMWGLSSCQRH